MHEYTLTSSLLFFAVSAFIVFFYPEEHTIFFRVIAFSMLLAIYSIYLKMKPAA